MSMICASGAIRFDHAVTGADEVVLEAEVGEEGDEHQSRTYDVAAARRRHVSLATATTSSPALPCLGRCLRTDRDHREPRAGRRERPGGGRRTRARRRSPSGARRLQLDRPVERQEVGAALVDEQPARPLGRGEQDAPAGAAARRAALPACGSPGRGRRRARARAAPPRSPGPIAAIRFGVAASRRASSRAPFAARDDDPVVPATGRSARRRAARSGSADSARPRDRAPRAGRRARPPGRGRVTTIFTARAPRARAERRRDRRRSARSSQSRPRPRSAPVSRAVVMRRDRREAAAAHGCDAARSASTRRRVSP